MGASSTPTRVDLRRHPYVQLGWHYITVSLHGGATAGASASASYVVRTTKAAGSKRLRLQAELGDLEAQVSRNSLADCQVLKRALEALHELAECLQRGEWTQTGWTADELGLWRAHLVRGTCHTTRRTQ